MARLFKQISLFSAFLALVLVLACFLPTTPKAKKSMLMSETQKDKLLEEVKSPRIIFIGGSNVCFGLNSRLIKDSLKLNPINTSVHASIGLIYMLNHAEKFIKKDDVVIISAEYQQFFDDFAYGSSGQELIKTLFDLNDFKFDEIVFPQYCNLVFQIPKYALSKFNPEEYSINSGLNPIDCFNEFGDITIHWGLQKQKFKSYQSVGNRFNHKVIDKIVGFNKLLQEKGANLYITFPCYQSSSYSSSISDIDLVEKELRNTKLNILGNSKRYEMSDTLMFDTPYHLTKKGVDLRTLLLIEDYKKYL